ncbi:aldo/keto reductase, partial [Actinophytocola sp.]|uniref:aldo/keto reductase n=1 Tax=Actinophytocola sp. TaxID=1872138 RepID=UPI00389AC5C4
THNLHDAHQNNKYNFTDRTYEDVLRHCELTNTAFVPYSPLAAGRLLGHGSAVYELATKYGATPAQLALAWLLQRSPVMMPIPGTSNTEHLYENLAAAQVELTQADVVAIGLAVDTNVTATVS